MADDEQPGLRRGDLDLEASRILRELADHGVLFCVDWEGLLRHLLREYHHGPVFKATQEELRTAAAGAFGFQPGELPLVIAELAAKVINECLHIEKLPRDEFVAVQEEVAKDLRTISQNIALCEDEKAVIEARDEPEDGDHQRLDYLKHKIRENNEARRQIIDFLERGVPDEVLHRTWKPYFSQFSLAWDMLHAPYRFRRVPHLYDPRNLSDVKNKFRDWPARLVREWVRLYAEERETFHQKLSQYVTSQNVVQELREGLSASHRLAARADVLGPALDAYDARQMAVFCNLVPIQIEGLIGDYCRELGIPDDSLRTAALANKLEQLNSRMEVVADFEYFRFRFPLLRNQVAHGRFDSASAARTADLLLLDLKDICRRLRDEALPVNKLVKLVREIDPQAPRAEDLLRLALMMAVDLPEFYGLAVQRADAENCLYGSVLWDWIEQLAGSDDEVVKAFLKPVVDAMKRRDLDGRRGRSVLQRIGEVAGSPTEDEFWMAAERH